MLSPIVLIVRPVAAMISVSGLGLSVAVWDYCLKVTALAFSERPGLGFPGIDNGA